MVTIKPAKKRSRKTRKKSDLQILNEARLLAGLPPRLEMPDRDNVWSSERLPFFESKTAQKAVRKKFPKLS